MLVEDNGPIHTSKLSLAALAARAHWLTVEWLPKYAPELNDIEAVWRDLKAHHLAHQTFADLDALDSAIRQAVDALNHERMALPLANSRVRLAEGRDIHEHHSYHYPARSDFRRRRRVLCAQSLWGCAGSAASSELF